MTSRRSKKVDPLNKVIPKNPRYSHVKATLDTGASLSKYLARIEDMRKNYRFRPDEIFKRLKATTFAQLVVQVALAHMLEEEEEEEREEDEVSTPLPEDDYRPDTARSTLTSIVHGIGELDVTDGDLPVAEPPLRVPPSSPYLLLDVRDPDDYQQCHIISAKSYPMAMLSRSCNYFTPEILDFRNKPGHIIILYDDNERLAPQAATVFVQRGVDNVFLLSGGLKVLHRTFPKGIITGTLPQSCRPSPPSSARRSQRTPRSQPLVPPVSMCFHPESLSHEDVTVLQEQLDKVLLAKEPPSSSRASTRSGRGGGGGGGNSGIGSRAVPGSCLASSRASSHITSPPVSSRGPTPWK